MAVKYNVRIKVVCIVILIKVNTSGVNYYRLYYSTYFQVELWTIFNSSHVITITYYYILLLYHAIFKHIEK